MKGQFDSTIDDKGRLMIPARLRKQLVDTEMVLTRGLENCLWLFPRERWKQVSEELFQNYSVFNLESQGIQRRIIAPAEDVRTDKMGRIKIPASLIHAADLERNCILVGMVDHIELWDVKTYDVYEKACEAMVRDAWSRLGESRHGSVGQKSARE